MATIKDVAQAAGVSLGTVSNYLNGSVPVAEATAERIQRAIDALGYRIDLGARALRAGETRSVGLVLPNISNPYYAEIARVIEHALWERGFQTLLCDAAHDQNREQSHLSNLVNRRVDGILLIYGNERDDLSQFIGGLGVPVVFVDRAMIDHPSVTTDNHCGGELVARHLVDFGHRHIGILVGESNVQNVQQRIRSFMQELGKHGLAFDERYMLSGPQALALGYRVGTLMKLEPRPTAIFATNDIVAIGAWRTLLELGYRIPEDVSLVGFDDIEMSGLLVPPLTTIAQDKQALGHEATNLLLSLIKRPSPAQTIVIPPRLAVRGSTRQLSSEHVSRVVNM